MRTVRIGVASRAEISARFKAAFRGERQGSHISFPSLELMHRVLTPNRWRMLQAMMASGPVGTRELARRLDRDVKSVHMDVQALLSAGVIDRTEDDKIEFPYDAAHVDFTVKAA
ncbi:MAG TPA: transcriptional regulator [Xanthobacteraceae bacterium]|jgi:predicted transcriptional regulator|nr:transcriptional regulator [Xanthobacteraceae bacterium]